MNTNTTLRTLGNEFLDVPGAPAPTYTHDDLHNLHIAAHPSATHYYVAYGELYAANPTNSTLATYCLARQAWLAV